MIKSKLICIEKNKKKESKFYYWINILPKFKDFKDHIYFIPDRELDILPTIEKERIITIKQDINKYKLCLH